MRQKVILIEGLASYRLGFLRKAYKDIFEAKGFEVVSLPYTAKGPFIADIVIGHSFGGGKILRDGAKARAVITLDPRYWDFWNNQNQTAFQLDISHALNCYQKSGLRGYPVNGMNNHYFGGVGHTQLPLESVQMVFHYLRSIGLEV
jgi:hypothetical protein